MTARTLAELHQIAVEGTTLVDPSKVSFQQFLHKACIGVSSQKPDASETEKINLLLDAFGTRFVLCNGEEVEHAMVVAGSVLTKSEAAKAAALTNERFWIGLFSIPVRIVKGTAIGFGGERTEKNKMIPPFNFFAALLARTPARNHEDLIRTCIRGKVFDILDEVAEKLLDLDKGDTIGHEGSAAGAKL